MEAIIALIKQYIVGTLSLNTILKDFEKVEADLKSFGQQQLELAEKLKAKADKIEAQREAALEVKERSERTLARIQALTE